MAFQLLEEKMQNLETSTQEFINLMLDSPDSTDEEIQKEYDEADQYKGMFIVAKLQVTEQTRENIVRHRWIQLVHQETVKDRSSCRKLSWLSSLEM